MFARGVILINFADKPILLIDDEQVTLTLTKEGLEKRGFSITAYSNPVEALEHLKENPDHYEFVITDKIMPQIDGMVLAKRVLEDNPKQKIILLSGFVDQKQEEELKEMGIHAIWQKPLSLREIASKLTEEVSA